MSSIAGQTEAISLASAAPVVTSVLSSDQLSAIHKLLDRIAERQRSDFGNIVSDVKPDGTLITACDRWSDAELVKGPGLDRTR